ncbi:hypothetical protein C8F04DRAFT_668562 [Mycena alexandri]|uniref:Uncharacterized protein n=1 Tax=Mycena alexandri TaxID=1745969 RepID=A0AAD6SQB9_9AGAR|nr:hypothetical protein C8F04DRAFT_668562 [Mycena alexandri]
MLLSCWIVTTRLERVGVILQVVLASRTNAAHPEYSYRHLDLDLDARQRAPSEDTSQTPVAAVPAAPEQPATSSPHRRPRSTAPSRQCPPSPDASTSPTWRHSPPPAPAHTSRRTTPRTSQMRSSPARGRRACPCHRRLISIFGGRRVAEEEENYKPEWTHPVKAEAGFVFDFAPPSEIVIPSTPPPAGKGKGKAKEVVIDVDAEVDAEAQRKERESVSTLLVCARCLDPLLVRADGVVEGGEAEVKRRKVWGLRCGHLIDGKCCEELRKPPPCVEAATSDGVDADAEGTSEEGKGKAKAKATGKGKGKGKAKAVDEEFEDEDEDELEPEQEQEEEHDELFDEDLIPAPVAQSSGIRSRLRPRPSTSAAAAAASTSASTSRLRSAAASSMPGAFELAVPSSPPPAPVLPRPRRRNRISTAGRGRGKPKGKGKATATRPKKRVVEARYEWVCPVAGCGRIHVSEKVDGEWENDAEKGAVGVFV